MWQANVLSLIFLSVGIVFLLLSNRGKNATDPELKLASDWFKMNSVRLTALSTIIISVDSYMESYWILFVINVILSLMFILFDIIVGNNIRARLKLYIANYKENKMDE